MMYKDRMGLFGEVKEILIGKATERCMVQSQPEDKERREWLAGVIEKEMAQVLRGKEAREKYERCQSRI